jgi:WD40 repeat protein
MATQIPEIYKLVFSPDGQWLAVIYQKDNIAVWRMRDKTLFKTWKAGHNITETIEFSRCSKYLASAGQNRTVKLWTTDTFSNPKILEEARDAVDSVQFSQEGYIAAGSRDGWVRVWKLSALEKPFKIYGYKGDAQSLALLSGTGLLAFKDKDHRVQIWDIVTQNQAGEFEIPGEKVEAVCASADGSYLAIGGNKQRLYLQKISRAHKLFQLPTSQIDSKIEEETGFRLEQFKLVPLPPTWK